MDTAAAYHIHMAAAVQMAVQDMLVGRRAQDSLRTAAAAVAVYHRIRTAAGVVAAVRGRPVAVAGRLAAAPVGGLAWDAALGPYAAVVFRTVCTDSAEVPAAQRHASCHYEHAWSQSLYRVGHAYREETPALVLRVCH